MNYEVDVYRRSRLPALIPFLSTFVVFILLRMHAEKKRRRFILEHSQTFKSDHSHFDIVPINMHRLLFLSLNFILTFITIIFYVNVVII